MSISSTTTNRWKPTYRSDKKVSDVQPDRKTTNSKSNKQYAIAQLSLTCRSSKSAKQNMALMKIHRLLLAPLSDETCQQLTVCVKDLHLERSIPEDGVVLPLLRANRQVQRCKIQLIKNRVNKLIEERDALLVGEITGEICVRLKEISEDLKSLKRSISPNYQISSAKALSSSLDQEIQWCDEVVLEYLLFQSDSLRHKEPTFENCALIRGVILELESLPQFPEAVDEIAKCKAFLFQKLLNETNEILSGPVTSEGGERLRELHQQMKSFPEEESVVQARSTKIRTYLATHDYEKVVQLCDQLLGETATPKSLDDLKQMVKVLENLKQWVPEAIDQIHKINLYLFEHR